MRVGATEKASRWYVDETFKLVRRRFKEKDYVVVWKPLRDNLAGRQRLLEVVSYFERSTWNSTEKVFSSVKKRSWAVASIGVRLSSGGLSAASCRPCICCPHRKFPSFQIPSPNRNKTD